MLIEVKPAMSVETSCNIWVRQYKKQFMAALAHEIFETAFQVFDFLREPSSAYT